MPNNDPLKKLFDKAKDATTDDYPEDLFEKRRGSFIRQIFLSKFFWLIVIALFIIICFILTH